MPRVRRCWRIGARLAGAAQTPRGALRDPPQGGIYLDAGPALRHDASVERSADQRSATRVDVALPCTLRRPVGRPIVARTLNIGTGGMLISSARPLTVDEPLDFDLANLDVPVSGRARVLRHERLDVYALRFERLAETMTSRLRRLAAS